MDLTQLAIRVTEEEGKKVSISIAQVKEVLKIVLKELKGMSVDELTTLLKKVK